MRIQGTGSCTSLPCFLTDRRDRQAGSKSIAASEDSRARLRCGIGFGPLMGYLQEVARSFSEDRITVCIG
jgi:hypothetical protein